LGLDFLLLSNKRGFPAAEAWSGRIQGAEILSTPALACRQLAVSAARKRKSLRSPFLSLSVGQTWGQEVIPMYRIAIPMQKAIPMQRMHEKREARARRPGFNAERALEIYFAVITIVILGGIVGLSAYTVISIVPAWQKYQSPAWQRSHFPVNLAYPQSVEFQSHSPDPK
jgi:hypothetical protein